MNIVHAMTLQLFNSLFHYRFIIFNTGSLFLLVFVTRFFFVIVNGIDFYTLVYHMLFGSVQNDHWFEG